VCITALAACLALNNSPQDLRMVMIDSKMVELLRFNGLPHLLGKVETSIERILGVLRWVVLEMEHRYRLLETGRARDLDAYNKKQARKEGGRTLPRIVVWIDELADLMMSAADETDTIWSVGANGAGNRNTSGGDGASTDVVTGVIRPTSRPHCIYRHVGVIWYLT
jgi:S-DNA-T family DNA segregation ATPase FtsK/SpoIIIE